jgi:dsDNA-specific endonuclease/ATPase MutS2
MAKVSFNFYDDDGSRISHQLRGDQVLRADYQIDRFLEFLLGQGFDSVDIFHHLDTLVNEYDEDNPGKLDGEFCF